MKTQIKSKMCRNSRQVRHLNILKRMHTMIIIDRPHRKEPTTTHPSSNLTVIKAVVVEVITTATQTLTRTPRQTGSNRTTSDRILQIIQILTITDINNLMLIEDQITVTGSIDPHECLTWIATGIMRNHCIIRWWLTRTSTQTWFRNSCLRTTKCRRACKKLQQLWLRVWRT